MKRDIEELRHNVLVLAEGYNRDIHAMEKVENYILSKNLLPGRFRSIINKNNPIEILSDIELGILAVAFYKATGEGRVDPETYYNVDELKAIENYIIEEEEKLSEIILENTELMSDTREIFTCAKVPIKQIANWLNQGLLTYNPKTQREIRRKGVAGNIVQRITIYQDAVEEISQDFINDDYFPNLITINIRENGYEDFYYNKNTKKLIIKKSENSFNDILDGMHRIAGIVNALKREPDLSEYMSVRIVHLDEVKAWNLIIQEDKAHKISEERKRTADPKDDDVKIAKEINTFGTNKSNALFNKIGEDDKDVLLTNKYTTTFILSEAIKYHFSYDNAREMRIIKEYLINFFNELFGILQEKYETIEDKEHYVYTDLRIFIGYITLAKKFYNRDTWEKELEALINSIDFSRDNSEWESLYLNNKKLITLKDIKRIEQYFDQLGGENNGTEKTGETA